jgi:L-threonylcarbamoyladenylate synthase
MRYYSPRLASGTTTFASMIETAKKLIVDEDIVAIPTETVYGLAGSIHSSIAIEKIFKIKERPFFDPLIVHVAGIDMAKSLTTEWSPISEALARAFWQDL